MKIFFKCSVLHIEFLINYNSLKSVTSLNSKHDHELAERISIGGFAKVFSLNNSTENICSDNKT